MSKTTDDILNNAMQLSTTERAELAAALLASLDGEPEEAVEAACLMGGGVVHSPTGSGKSLIRFQ